MKRSGGMFFATLAKGAGGPPQIQVGDVVCGRAAKHVLVAALDAGPTVRGWPIVPQTSPRHRGELRLEAEHVSLLGMRRHTQWLIRCNTTVLVAPVACLGTLGIAMVQAAQRTARRAAVSDAMEAPQQGAKLRRRPSPRRVWDAS